jgi:hypothetical protein
MINSREEAQKREEPGVRIQESGGSASVTNHLSRPIPICVHLRLKGLVLRLCVNFPVSCPFVVCQSFVSIRGCYSRTAATTRKGGRRD